MPGSRRWQRWRRQRRRLGQSLPASPLRPGTRHQAQPAPVPIAPQTPCGPSSAQHPPVHPTGACDLAVPAGCTRGRGCSAALPCPCWIACACAAIGIRHQGEDVQWALRHCEVHACALPQLLSQLLDLPRGYRRATHSPFALCRLPGLSARCWAGGCGTRPARQLRGPTSQTSSRCPSPLVSRRQSHWERRWRPGPAPVTSQRVGSAPGALPDWCSGVAEVTSSALHLNLSHLYNTACPPPCLPPGRPAAAAVDEYVATFDPLVLEEAREGLKSDWAEACGGQAWPVEVAG